MHFNLYQGEVIRLNSPAVRTGQRIEPQHTEQHRVKRQYRKLDDDKTDGGRPDDGLTVGQRRWSCKVGSYNNLARNKAQRPHHTITDTLNRTSLPCARLPGLPSLAGGPTICLICHVKMGGTEHIKTHKGDTEIREAAKRTDNGLLGTVPVKEAVPIAMQSAINARPECKTQIEAEVRKAYPNYEKDNRSMNGAGKPPTGETKAHLDKGGNAAANGQMNVGSRKGKK